MVISPGLLLGLGADVFPPSHGILKNDSISEVVLLGAGDCSAFSTAPLVTTTLVLVPLFSLREPEGVGGTELVGETGARLEDENALTGLFGKLGCNCPVGVEEEGVEEEDDSGMALVSGAIAAAPTPAPTTPNPTTAAEPEPEPEPLDPVVTPLGSLGVPPCTDCSFFEELLGLGGREVFCFDLSPIEFET